MFFHSDEELEATVVKYIERLKIDSTVAAKVAVGYDTRQSSVPLAQALIAGVECAGGQTTDFKLLSTPQLHYIVRCISSGGQYGEPTEVGYYRKLSKAYLNIVGMIEPADKYQPCLVVDGANGVGAIKVKQFSTYLNDSLKFEVVDDPSGVLNLGCGADYVKVNQREPSSLQLEPNKRYVSLDGDADRLIYYYQNSKDHKFHMLDGDKIAVLIAKYLKETLVKAGLDDIALSIIQTAYANGSSTNYIRQVLQVDTHCVPTGVKHLHHKAEQCEIGIYFEANGHGTIVFSDKVQQKISASNSIHARQLVQFIDLVNQVSWFKDD